MVNFILFNDNYTIEYYFKNISRLYNSSNYTNLYKFLYVELQQNKFIKDSTKKDLLDNYYKNIKLIRAIRKLTLTYFINRKIVVSHNKYLLDFITKSNDSINSIKLYNKHTSNFYTFSQNEIVSLFKHALLNHCDTFPEPFIPKNPWTNIRFNLSECIYLLNSIKIKIPQIIHLFKDSGYSIKSLNVKYANYLIEKSCENYANDLTDKEFCNEVNIILNDMYPKPCYKCLETILGKDFRKTLTKIVEKSVKQANLDYCIGPDSENMMKNIFKQLNDMGNHSIHRVVLKPIYKNNNNINFTNHDPNELFIFGKNI